MNGDEPLSCREQAYALTVAVPEVVAVTALAYLAAAHAVARAVFGWARDRD